MKKTVTVKAKRVKSWSVKAEREHGAAFILFELFDEPPVGYSMPLAEIPEMARQLASLVPSPNQATGLQ